MRLQLVFSDSEGGILKGIMDQCGIRTKVECIRNALSLLWWIVQQLMEGRKIISQKEGTPDRELAAPWIVAREKQ